MARRSTSKRNTTRSSASRSAKKGSAKVAQAMRERKRGTLRSGGSGKKVTSRKQAIAIGLSQARKEGARIPEKRGGRSSGDSE